MHESVDTTKSDSQSGRVVLTVSQLNREVRELLEQGLPVLWVEGEVSNLARPASGHWYFTLKDQKAQIRCAMFRPRNRLVRFQPDNGTQVLARGRISLYEPRGDYQFIVESLEEAGDGALRRQFEALKQALEAEGLFRQERKRALPAIPRRVGVITSPSGAAIRDVLQVLQRRFSAMEVLVYPVPVQGKGAAEQIAGMIQLAADRNEVDVLLLTRGGGSLEDLWAFNEEVVARAIAACPIPLVSAIGHEVDVSIADFVADQRAPTPSAAAELISPDGLAWRERFRQLEDRLAGRMLETLRRLQRHLDFTSTRLQQQHPGRRLRDHSQRLDELDIRLRGTIRRHLQLRQGQLGQLEQRLQRQHPNLLIGLGRERLQGLEGRLLGGQKRELRRQGDRLRALARALEAISPLATVSRGYAILQREDGTVVRHASAVSRGDTLSARLAHGRLVCSVEETVPEDAETQD
ncbi:MAG: exodeoxyribonuclease VII large subunit [Ectothiorhodospiraceae bacterium]|nr:exodeoxyribonuclease VII large subunit [Ectothiorhodospiraceae bacterium]MCH8505148.1 exodeoxyribonuclease VII large subunit [Ectothiorhodospiraceae bacterium]